MADFDNGLKYGNWYELTVAGRIMWTGILTKEIEQHFSRLYPANNLQWNRKN